ncbi:MAG TPA: phosphoglycerate kinase [Bacteroidales bacterium]|jgi:phosphoglycerate kinase|nr:phosphoglycerate kinase [Bacteroidales bacterium]MDI9573387.1 phosphoglycerate kinase [Bacteroidota bacterium]OQC60278.1 MAG: Bifunctional PGK [Bacteroidetes bacterium ADurb.Bin012]MBP9512659.1 phosphoglycerate kinase [Bacteroidales bacterium]MBP9587650.1 phosphoglycerate kinase [Bacteroidales bacterium]
MKTIDDFNFKNKRALMRVDFNVPLDDKFQIADTTRIDVTLPTIRKILNDGGCVILMSHLGRPKDGPSDKYSLRHLLPYLRKVTGVEVKFAPDCVGEDALKMALELKPGEILLLENLRFYKEEEKGDEEFARKLARLGDVYVNDAFGAAHRAHASTAVIAKFFPQAKMFGYVMGNELAALKKVLEEAEHPFTAILGGAKVSGKIDIIRNLMKRVDNLIIGGGMIYTFIKAQGGKVGNSLVEDELISLALETLEKAKQLGIKIFLPVDIVIADKFDNEANRKVCKADEIPDGWMGLDIGPKTIELFKDVITHSKTLLWNGPMGVFEMSNFETGTVAIAQCIAEATAKGAFSLVGGGDSVAAINKYQLADRVSYVSTGGGAMLEYIEGKELPGVKFVDE